eukprot:UN04348
MGITIFDMLIGANPFASIKLLERRNTAKPKLPKSLSKNARNLLQHMFGYEEHERAGHPNQGGFLQLKQHPWFSEDKSFSWEKLEHQILDAPWTPSKNDEPPSNQMKKRAPTSHYVPNPDLVDPFHDYHGFNDRGYEP